MSPNGFITLAEETGVIVPLGLKILEEACSKKSPDGMAFPKKLRI
jgi:EAL domain-containing protein (putative c-di-GMP-specific phosphodiesterase class I)